MEEDWELLLTFFPDGWEDLAMECGSLKGLSKDKSADSLLRVLLLHLGCGHSLRETVVRARQAGLADLSDVALMKRLRKSRPWLHALCVSLMREQGISPAADECVQMRVFDATTVKEPGTTGSLWRLHYSGRLPSPACDHFKLTEPKGPGTGESFEQFPLFAGDLVVAGRGYSTAAGLFHVVSAGAHATVRVNTASLVFTRPDGGRFALLAAVSSLEHAGVPRSWKGNPLGP